MELQKIILINGPPRVGKDTLARLLLEGLPSAARIGFADALKEGCHATYGLFDANGRPRPHAYYELAKDKPLGEFFGKTPRWAYIEHSERYMKLIHGQRIWGRMFAERRKRAEYVDKQVIIVPDSGFTPEAEVQIDGVGSLNVLLIRLHREGCTFEGDSRGYIELPGVVQLDLPNCRSEGALGRDGLAIVQAWLERRKGL